MSDIKKLVGEWLNADEEEYEVRCRLLDAVDALAARLAEAEKLLRGALVEIEATGAAEGYYFGPDPQIDEKIIRFLANEP